MSFLLLSNISACSSSTTLVDDAKSTTSTRAEPQRGLKRTSGSMSLRSLYLAGETGSSSSIVSRKRQNDEAGVGAPPKRRCRRPAPPVDFSGRTLRRQSLRLRENTHIHTLRPTTSTSHHVRVRNPVAMPPPASPRRSQRFAGNMRPHTPAVSRGPSRTPELASKQAIPASVSLLLNYSSPPAPHDSRRPQKKRPSRGSPTRTSPRLHMQRVKLLRTQHLNIPPPQPSPSQQPSPPPTNLPRSANGSPTRVEVQYESFREHVLLSPQDDAQIQDVARKITKTSKWKAAAKAYTSAVCHSYTQKNSGMRKNRFLDLLNCILEEGSTCDPTLRYAHDIKYQRCAPEEDDDEEESYSDGGEQWRDDITSPCAGLLPPTPHTAGDSVWDRAALVVDVYNPTIDSAAESFAGTEDITLKRRYVDDDYDSDEDEVPRTETRAAKKLRLKRKAYVNGDTSIDWSDSSATGKWSAGLRTPKSIMQYPRLSVVPMVKDYWPKHTIDDNLSSFASRITHAVGNRRHVLGIHAKGFQIRFYLYDRGGTIYSTALNLLSEPAAIAAAILSISCLDAIGLGLEPVLASNSLIPASNLLQMRAKSYIEVQGVSFYLQSILHTDFVIGRGTTVYAAIPATLGKDGAPVPTTHPDIPSEVVIKLSWPDPAASSEERLLKLAEERGVQGVARLYRSQTVCRLSDGLRGRLVPKHLYVDRELRIQVTGPRAIPLYEVADLETFKEAFRSLVTIHHDLFEKAGILHRDISIGNLMVEAANQTQGVLIDFDFAAVVDQNGDPMDGGSLPHAGALPFRAHDLVGPNRPHKAWYRHDLESFLYVLLWIQTNYPNGKAAETPPNCPAFTFNRTWETTRYQKEGFLLQHSYPHTLPDFALRDEWVAPLRSLFGKAFSRGNFGEYDLQNDRTLGGAVTFETFIRVLASED